MPHLFYRLILYVITLTRCSLDSYGANPFFLPLSLTLTSYFFMFFHVTDLLILITTIRTTNTQPYYINALLLHTNPFCPAICVPLADNFSTTYVNNY